MHHAEYKRPDVNVTPLSLYVCRKCHAQLHRKGDAWVLRAMHKNAVVFWRIVRGVASTRREEAELMQPAATRRARVVKRKEEHKKCFVQVAKEGGS